MQYSDTATYTSAAMDAADENTPMYFCEDFSRCTVTLVSASSANATVKLYGGSQEARPSLSSALSATNVYNTVSFNQLDIKTNIDGDTGVAWAGTDATYQIEVDTAGLRWIGMEMTARSA